MLQHKLTLAQMHQSTSKLLICVGAMANRGRWDQGCSLPMATHLGQVRATRRKKKLYSYSISSKKR